MPNQRGIKPFIAVAISSLLVACGGSNDSSAPASPAAPAAPAATTYPLNTFYTNFITSAQTFTLTATDTSTTPSTAHSVIFSLTPGGDTSFEGQAVKTTQEKAIETISGVVQPAYIVIHYFTIGPFKDIGLTAENYVVSANQTALPETAIIGDLGKFFTDTAYKDSTKTTNLGTNETTWTLETGPTSTTAYFCTTRGAKQTETEKICNSLDSKGVSTGKMTYTNTTTSNGVSSSLKYSN